MASADVNGDGFHDVILGAQHGDPPGGEEAGEVLIGETAQWDDYLDVRE